MCRGCCSISGYLEHCLWVVVLSEVIGDPFWVTHYAQLTSSVGVDLGLTHAMRVLMYWFTLWSNTC
jgi:hypothetical protein